MMTVRTAPIIALLLVPLFVHVSTGDERIVPLDVTVPRFENVTHASGLYGVRGDSFAWADWNGDGLQDLLVKGSRLFKNLGPPTYSFAEVTDEVGLENSGYSVFADLDGDSLPDIFSVGHPYSYQDSVWLNTGPPSYAFRNVSSLSGIDDGMPGLACGAGDMDRDGDLDIYVVNWRDDANVKYPDVLWRNDGGGKFTDITRDAGIVDWNVDRNEPNAGMGVNMGDYNDDGWIDIYVSNYLITPNYLFENQGDGTFVDVALEKGCAGEPTPGLNDTYYGHTAGSQWADTDNDGDLDLWCSNLAHKDPYRTLICDDSQLFRNDGRENGYSFTNIRDQTGIPTNRLGNEELFFGIAWGDIDNDGDLDMFVPQVKNYIDYAYSYIFVQNEDGTFTDISDEAGLRIWDCVGGAWCDYDRDGDLDLIADGKYPYENGTYETRLYRNSGVPGNGFLHIDLEGTMGNPDAVGARVSLFEDEELLGMREVEGGTAGHSFGPSATQEFGLGKRRGPFTAEIRWPEGRIQIVDGLERDSMTVIREPSSIDIRVDARFSSRSVTEGDELTLELLAENMGGSYMRDATLVLDSPAWARTVRMDDLAPGERSSVTVQLSTEGMAGEISVKVGLGECYPPDEVQENDIWTGTVLIGSSNRAPEIEGIDLGDGTVPPGHWLNLSAIASDPDGDELDFEFLSDHGSFLQDGGPNSKWLAPSGPEVAEGLTVRIEVVATDGRGGSDRASGLVRIEKRRLPPVVSALDISTASPPNDGSTQVRLEARVLDDGEIWKVSADLAGLGGRTSEPMGDAGTMGDLVPGDGVYTVTFTIPGSVEEGSKRITVTAYDTDMLGSSRTIDVWVRETDRAAGDRGSPVPLILAGATVVLAVLVIGSLIAVWRKERRALQR